MDSFQRHNTSNQVPILHSCPKGIEKRATANIELCCLLFYDETLRKFCYHVRNLSAYTVIRFVSISAKFGICAIVGLNWTLVKLKYAHSSVPMSILA
jgi:hypothetical protein